MAQVSAPVMSRRAPLTNIPNAVNSTYNASAVTKRSRSQSISQRENQGQPPQKRQALENSLTRTPVRQNVDAKTIPPKKPAVRSRPVTISANHKLSAVVQKPAQRKPPADESILQWRRHYRKAFPNYVFFFESIPQEVILKAQEPLSRLGASQEKFFSSKVTHVISNRDPPPEETRPKPNANTADPSAIQRDASIKIHQRRIQNAVKVDIDCRKIGRIGNDILTKAREYGMKIWTLDKLERVLNGLLDVPLGEPTLTFDLVRGNKTSGQSFNLAGKQGADLSQLLRNERLHGPTDRDPCVISKDLQFFKGPMIYIRDASHTHRPIMVREYPKVQRREDGTWPQFRSVSGGKCPFIEERPPPRREKTIEKEEVVEKTEEAKERERAERREIIRRLAKAREEEAAPKKKVVQNNGDSFKVPPEARLKCSSKDVRESENAGNRSGTKEQSFRVPSLIASKRSNQRQNEIAFTATNESTSHKLARYNQEPIASGVQPSNITSAIRSQMVSSHLDQPGQRAGTSKELFGLHRKVAGNVLLANPATKAGDSTSQRMLNIAGAATAAGKAFGKRDSNAREKPSMLQRQNSQESRGDRSCSTSTVTAAPKREPRPGYCENCREKFDDFEEHTYSRRHRKFATDPQNWVELDELLHILWRPAKKTETRQRPK